MDLLEAESVVTRLFLEIVKSENLLFKLNLIVFIRGLFVLKQGVELFVAEKESIILARGAAFLALTLVRALLPAGLAIGLVHGGVIVEC